MLTVIAVFIGCWVVLAMLGGIGRIVIAIDNHMIKRAARKGRYI